MYVLGVGRRWFGQSLSKIFISFPKDSKRNPIGNILSRDLLVARELSSVSVIKDGALYSSRGKVQGLHSRVPIATTQLSHLKQIL